MEPKKLLFLLLPFLILLLLIPLLLVLVLVLLLLGGSNPKWPNLLTKELTFPKYAHSEAVASTFGFPHGRCFHSGRIVPILHSQVIGNNRLAPSNNNFPSPHVGATIQFYRSQ